MTAIDIADDHGIISRRPTRQIHTTTIPFSTGAANRTLNADKIRRNSSAETHPSNPFVALNGDDVTDDLARKSQSSRVLQNGVQYQPTVDGIGDGDLIGSCHEIGKGVIVRASIAPLEAIRCNTRCGYCNDLPIGLALAGWGLGRQAGLQVTHWLFDGKAARSSATIDIDEVGGISPWRQTTQRDAIATTGSHTTRL